MRLWKTCSCRRKELPVHESKKSKPAAAIELCFSPGRRKTLDFNRVFGSCSILILLAPLLVSCARGAGPASTRNPAPETHTRFASVIEPFRIVAYATEGIAENQIPYAKLTHLNYSFLVPNADGSFKPIGNPTNLKKIVAACRSHNVHVSIAVGGWGWDSEFEQMAANAATRAAFIRNLAMFVHEFDLDGTDIDWEYPDPGQSSQNFLALIRELRAALPNKILTAAVVAYGDANGMGIPAESFVLLDFVNIMTYDGGDHGSMEQFNKGLQYWKGRGLPKSKSVPGVPFYSRAKASPGQTASYARLVTSNPAAAQTDICELSGLTHRYNGIPTIQTKTRIALQSAGGIMFWVLDADAPGEFSLLKAIHQTVHPD